MSPDIAVIVVAAIFLTTSLPFAVAMGLGLSSYIIHLFTCEVCRGEAKRLIISRFRPSKE